MQIVADTHVHLYPALHDLARQLASALANLTAAAPHAQARLLCLTERAGQRVFADLRAGAPTPAGWTQAPGIDPDAVTLVGERGALTLIAGRQIVTAERIEVLALGRDLDAADGLPLDDTLARVRAGDAIPVLPWGLGKWLGRRGRIVRNMLDTARADTLAFADTCLRPDVFPEPALLRSARSRGFSILYGSDPLPRSNEEDITGRLATLWEGDWDPAHPAAAWRRIVRAGTPGRAVGRRCGIGEALRRMA